MHSHIMYRDYVAPRHHERRRETARRQRQIAAGILGVSIPDAANTGLSIPGVAHAPIAETPLPLPGASIPDTSKPVVEKPSAKKPGKKKVDGLAVALGLKPEQVAKPMGETDHAFTHGSNPGGDGDTYAETFTHGTAKVDSASPTENPNEPLIEGEPQKAPVKLGNDKEAIVLVEQAEFIEQKVKNVGKRVSWTAFGKDSTGSIFCVVPIGMTPSDLSIGSGKSKAKPRDTLSYVVEVDGGGHAWPETKALKILKD